MTIIYFVRHGKTSYTGNRISGYIPGVHLTKEGQSQALQAARHLENKPVSAVYASPLERTMETAAFIAEIFKLDINKVDFLKEIHFGLFQGMGKELEQEPTWQVFLTTPSQARFPQGESVTEAQERVVKGLNQLSQSHAPVDEIVCVSHCETIRLALAYALKKPLDSYMETTIETGSISQVEWEIGHPRVISINLIP